MDRVGVRVRVRVRARDRAYVQKLVVCSLLSGGQRCWDFRSHGVRVSLGLGLGSHRVIVQG